MGLEAAISEGLLDFKIPSIDQVCQTWYKVFGQLQSGVRPLIALHGGPGVNSAYLEILSDITNGRPDHPLIVYDQLGSGKSTHLQEKMGDTEFWTIQLFIDELKNLIEKLGIAEYDLLGHSWGGMLAASYAILKPPGLKHLILSSSPPSMALWTEAQNILRARLPKDMRDVMDKHEKSDTTDSKEYQDALGAFYARHICTLDPMPPPICEGFECIAQDPTVYHTM